MREDLGFSDAAIDWDKGDGLVPAIVQSSTTGAVLMLGYMNEQSLVRTLETERVTFFSRSRDQLWVKGETSGNHLSLKSIHLDCDGDALLVKATPHGPTCHLGTTSCFNDQPAAVQRSALAVLQDDIDGRLSAVDPDSYTVSLIEQGTARIAQKVGEEAVEVVVAAMGSDDAAFLEESADLLYHLLVLIRAKGMGLEDVEKVLSSRRK